MEAERVGRNDAVVREAKEHIGRQAARVDGGEPLPLICECADPACQAVIRLSRAQYERVRAKATHFAIAPAHDEEAFGRVVERHDGFSDARAYVKTIAPPPARA